MLDKTPVKHNKDVAYISHSVVATTLQYQLDHDIKRQPLSEVDQNLFTVLERMEQGEPTPPHISKILSENILDLF